MSLIARHTPVFSATYREMRGVVVDVLANFARVC
jgi:hypothetical protein